MDQSHANPISRSLSSPALMGGPEGGLDQLIAEARSEAQTADTVSGEPNGNISNVDVAANTTSSDTGGDMGTNSSIRDTENVEAHGSTVGPDRQVEQPAGAEGVWNTPRKLLNKAISKIKGNNAAGQGNEGRGGAKAQN